MADQSRTIRIPAHMIAAPSSDSMTYATVEQQSLDFVRFSLTPWLRRVELAVSSDRDLTFDRQYVQFSIDALLRPDSAGRAAFYREALDPIHGWLTRAEVRELEDMPPEPEPSPAAVMARAINNVMEASTNGNGS